MATTAVFAEILLVGVQALIWIALAAMIVVGPEKVTALEWEALDSWSALLSFVALGLAYAAGVVVDKLADVFFEALVRPLLVGKKDPEHGKKRLFVRLHGGDMTTFLDYVRNRLRIARATALNIALITGFAAWLVPGGAAKVLVACFGISAFGLTVFAWTQLDATWTARLEQAVEIAKKAAEKAA